MRIEEIKDDLMVEVFNDYHSSVGVKLDRVSRKWDVGTAKKIRMDELYETVNMKGGRFLLEENILLIKDPAVRETLNLPELSEYNPDLKEIEKILTKDSNKRLEEILSYCSDTTLEKIVQKAIQLPISDMSKARLIKAYSGKDIIMIINEKEDAQKIENINSDLDGKAKREPLEPTEQNPTKRRRVVSEE